MQSKITIFVDHRELQSECFKCLEKNSLIDLQVKTLVLGDYEAGNIIYERKSLVDGRLFSQMSRMLLKAKYSVFLIEGHPEEIGTHGVSRSALQGALINLTLMHGIPVLYALDPQETALLIIYVAQQQFHFSQGGVARSGYAPKRKEQRKLYILQGLPGIGVKRAKLLMAHFKSIREVINASVEDLQQIDGIGKQIAQTIHEILK